MKPLNLTKKTEETAAACRFCWMCRHCCPVGGATGLERHNARTRALSVDALRRGTMDWPEIVDNLYDCALCGACVEECATGWNPVDATLDARLAAALEGETPEEILPLIERAEENVAAARSSDAAEGETVFRLGFGKENSTAAVRLLKKAGVSFGTAEIEPPSGYELLFYTGRSEETQNALRVCAESLRGKTVVAYDPLDALMLTRYPAEFGISADYKVIPFTVFLADLLEKGKITPKKGKKTYVFQDPFALSRELLESDAARKILAACGSVREMFLHGKKTVAAGSLPLRAYRPETVKLMARRRWDDAHRTGARTLVTSDPSEYVCLAETKPDSMELLSIEEVLLACL